MKYIIENDVVDYLGTVVTGSITGSNGFTITRTLNNNDLTLPCIYVQCEDMQAIDSNNTPVFRSNISLYLTSNEIDQVLVHDDIVDLILVNVYSNPIKSYIDVNGKSRCYHMTFQKYGSVMDEGVRVSRFDFTSQWCVK